ncbi:MAG: M14 family zinc carboxypeptidase, partial [Bacteroidota bacterium]
MFRLTVLLVLFLFPIMVFAQEQSKSPADVKSPVAAKPPADVKSPADANSSNAAAASEQAAPWSEDDPCGFMLRKPGDAQVWAYGRDALVADMQGWALHPMLSIDVIGSSVQGRPLYHMVLTNPASQLPKKRIWIHARTHPIESESSFVARAIVEELLGGSALGNLLLDNAIVHILPMLNPDGVELQRDRENANDVDLESNWGAASPEPEVEALRRHLTALMNSHNPVEVALNLHSAYNCKRYFVYHAAAGSSDLFTQLEQRFIGFARARFPGGI